jgi:hypothetical protein
VMQGAAVLRLPQGSSGGAAARLQGMAGLGGEAKAGPDTDQQPGPSIKDVEKASSEDEKAEGFIPDALGAGRDEGNDTSQPHIQVSSRFWRRGPAPSRSPVSRDRREGPKQLYEASWNLGCRFRDVALQRVLQVRNGLESLILRFGFKVQED